MEYSAIKNCDDIFAVICQKGCGLPHHKNAVNEGGHCCMNALREQNELLQAWSDRIASEVRKLCITWGEREQFLLSQLTALQTEAQDSAMKYQQRLKQYMLCISSILDQISGSYETDSEGSGIFVSHVSEEGPAGRADGMQVHDRVLEKSTCDLTWVCLLVTSCVDPVISPGFVCS
ncbi:E3 ubiquitin-protein ligase PDZRN3-like [Alosa sapidissima]|uniref:E3 ubiquitin-protein ligase PDZRN3-like n=1 Tax=Alosa sapidissima TaxID=34773 RepID=UPI001C082591|nr:E3 ubiquitin-protein ligase PDZRN3-like [Alosa sapidissima]